MALLNQEDFLKKNVEETSVMKAQNSQRQSWNRGPNSRVYRPKKHCKVHGYCAHDDEQCYNQKQTNTEKDVVKYVHEEECESEHEFFFSVQCSEVRGTCDENLMLVDSGCTSHIENSSDDFIKFNQNFKPGAHKITLADGTKSKDAVKGVGDATTHLADENGGTSEFKLHDVLLIPDFPDNIVSVHKSVQDGHTFVFSPEGSYLKTKKGGMLLK